ncbi:MAG TPA: FAD-binding protein [Thermoleophilaceae bacterium]|nr:FAD-binding protein [Thermoleophilaceae bacterium]
MNLSNGTFLTPEDEGFDAARAAWNLAVDQRPAAVAFADDAEDVAGAVRLAADRGLRVAVQATGHSAAPMGDLDGTLLLKTMRMNGFSVDPAARRARVEAGTLWADVAVAAGEHGLVALHGSSPDVGVVGFSLGGGLGWLSRRHGLACNRVVAAEAVTADGERRRASRDEEPDLFWALRGGGGSFAAVTALEFELLPLTEVYAGWLVWDAGAARDVVHAFREWSRSAPREITTSLRFLHLPPFPDVPEPLRDRPVIAFDGAYIGLEADGAELVRPLREVAPLVMDTFATIPAPQLVRLHGDPEQPVPGIGDGFQLRELTPEAADVFVELGGPGSGSPLLMLELRQLGGALAEAPEGAGALAALADEYTLYGVGMVMGEGMAEAIGAHLARVREAMAPWSAGVYLNFCERRGGGAPDAFDEETYGRLREIKSRYDANDLFRSNHPVEPALRPAAT